jgi:hypothetical protein
MPVTGRSLRAPALRSLDADFASPSWLRSSATPAPGHGQPLAHSPVAQVFNLCAFQDRIGIGVVKADRP